MSTWPPTPTSSSTAPKRPVRLLPLVAAIAIAIAIVLVVSGQPGKLVEGGLTYLPFVILVLLAYTGVRRRWARVATVLWLLIVLVGGATAVGLGLMLSAVASVEDHALPGWLPLAYLLGVALALGCYLPPVRRLAARVLPLAPDSFVHATALATVVSLTWLSCVPLLALGQAPLLVSGILEAMNTGAPATTREQLSELATALAWTIPTALLAVGYPLVRNLGTALARLALVVPTRRQLALGLAVAVALVVLMDPLTLLISLVWNWLGWPVSPAESVERLFARNLNPVGAVVMGITAGLSEELLCRGVLQPRLGLLLPNLFFTALHAYQYNFDGLLTVFILGLAFGVLRTRANTSVCALVHGLYDFLVVMITILELPTLTTFLNR
ncbi:MAG: CPBP family intramembrane metalloprotease [Chloroflexi bacterium]|nr:CPBP family intramembrane metalloprotease [Chloroflexota bacterium]